MNSGAWEDPLPLSTTSKITSQLHTIGSRRSEPLHPFSPLHKTITSSNTGENNNHLTPSSPFNSSSHSTKAGRQPELSKITASTTTAAATINNLLNGNHLPLHTDSQLPTNNKNRRRLEHTPSARTISSEESWCSSEKSSEHDLSSDGEDEKSERSIASINIRNSQLRSTLSKAKQHLSFEKWRNHYNNNSSSNQSAANNAMASQAAQDATSPGESPAGRLSRWFSIRRGSTHQYDVGGKDVRDGRANSVDSDDKSLNQQLQQQPPSTGVKMPLLPEVHNTK